jgi:hypothetical protein
MPTSVKFSIAALSLAVGISACRDASANSASAQAELKRDLEMAASATINLAAPRVDPALLTLEGQPQSAPQTSRVMKKSAGNRAVRSQTPTVRAEPEVEVAALDESEVAESIAEAAAPENSEPVAVAPRPAPVVIQTGGGGDYGNGGGIFGGGMGGVVIRGGGVDGDNCELHRRGRGGHTGPIFRVPTPTAGGSVIPRRTGTSIGMGRFDGARRQGSSVGSTRVSRPSSGIQSVGRTSIGRRSR